MGPGVRASALAGRHSPQAVTAVDADGKCRVASSVSTNFVLDIVGYWR